MTCMNKRFFDTNILFYAYDSSVPKKQAVAQTMLAESAADGSGCISVQVLGEFFHATVVRKHLLSADEAESAIRNLGALQIVDIDYAMVRAAIEVHRKYQTSYWDSLIVAAAKRSHCVEVVSEDFSAGQSYDGMAVLNPFA